MTFTRKAWYPLSTNSNDLVGGYNGTDTSMSYAQGEGVFSGSGSIAVPSGAQVTGNGARTFIALVKWDYAAMGNGTIAQIIGMGNEGNGTEYQLGIYKNTGDGNSPYLYVRRYMEDSISSYADSRLTNGLWRVIVATYNGVNTGTHGTLASEGLSFWIDEYRPTPGGWPYGNNQTFNTQTGNPRIGAGTGIQNFIGRLKHVMTFSSELNEFEVAKMVQHLKGMF